MQNPLPSIRDSLRHLPPPPKPEKADLFLLIILSWFVPALSALAGLVMAITQPISLLFSLGCTAVAALAVTDLTFRLHSGGTMPNTWSQRIQAFIIAFLPMAIVWFALGHIMPHHYLWLSVWSIVVTLAGFATLAVSCLLVFTIGK